jgi:mannan endo-1,4-beta-mannosidase
MARPVTPDASSEAVNLLEFVTGISGHQTLAGQHNVPLVGSNRLEGVHKAIGRYPAVFGQDFGFARAGDWDGINFRQRTIDEAIRLTQEGFIVTLMWHAVRPIEEEPVTFRDAICGKLSDAQWKDLITPGSAIHERWKSQVDVIAWHLKQLREAAIPVLWRPYHEMNGGWFWWGKRPGENGTKKLYRMLFERLVNFHRLNNLIWVYNCNELTPGIDSYETHYPGDDVVDILATDVYHGGFAKKDYDAMLSLARGKPIALGEVGVPPSPQVLEQQPGWAWFMVWGEPSEWLKDPKAARATYGHPGTLTLEQLPWVKKKDAAGN